MGKDYTITYDFGTGSVKAALIDKNQNVLAWDSVPYKMYHPEPSFAIQKVDDYWNCFCSITKNLMERACIDKSEIKGIVISQTTATIIFVDENNHYLNDCVTWIDNRGIEQAIELNEKVGIKDWTQSKRVPAKILWFIQNCPELVDEAKYMLDVSAYFYLRLTGQTGFDVTAAIAYDLAIPEEMKWNDKAINLIGMRRDLLPDRILYAYEKVGEMLPGDAEDAGFAPGTPIFAGCSDNANGHLGSGCIHPGDAHLYMGSSGWISVTVAMPNNSSNVMQSAIPGLGYEYYCTDSVGTSIDYLISEFYKKESQDNSIDIYTLIAEEAQSVEDKCEDTFFLPFLYGEEEPVLDPAVRGSLINIKPTTTRAHIARAVMEGTAFNYRWIKEKLTNKGAWNINFLRAIGGGTQNDVHLQIIADVMGEKIIRLKNARVAGNIGLSACVDIGLGIAKDFTILDDYIKVDKVFEPRPEFKERYDRLFKVYKKIYYDLKDTYDVLNL